jgi:hypothetical protein
MMNEHLDRCPKLPHEAKALALPSYSRIRSVLTKKFGQVEADRLLIEARQVQRLSGRALEDILVGTAGLSRGVDVAAKISKIARKAAARSRLRLKGYNLVRGIRVYGGGAPGLKQQR